MISCTLSAAETQACEVAWPSVLLTLGKMQSATHGPDHKLTAILMKRQTKCRGEYLERCRGLGEDVSAVLFGFGCDLGLARSKELSVSTEWY